MILFFNGGEIRSWINITPYSVKTCMRWARLFIPGSYSELFCNISGKRLK